MFFHQDNNSQVISEISAWIFYLLRLQIEGINCCPPPFLLYHIDCSTSLSHSSNKSSITTYANVFLFSFKSIRKSITCGDAPSTIPKKKLKYLFYNLPLHYLRQFAKTNREYRLWRVFSRIKFSLCKYL
jgi:hypothetical protein